MKKTIIGFVTILTLLGSCKKDISPYQGISYEEVLKSGGDFPEFQNQKVLVNASTTSVSVDSGNWNCTNITWNILQGDMDFPLYDPNVSVVYPGSLLQGKSLTNATPDVVAVKRGGGTVSIDIINGSGAVSFYVNEVKKSNITKALNTIVKGNNQVMPARFTFQHESIKTKEELSLALGLNADILDVTAASNLSFSNEDKTNHYLVSLKQTFYTMSFDIPYNYNDLFDTFYVKPMDLAKYVYRGNPACYVSDVTYGRVYYLLIESTSSSNTITAAVNASYNNIDGTMNTNYLSSLENLNVKVIALGGANAGSFSSINATNLSALTNFLSQSSDMETGVPLSYVVRTVYNNKLVKNKLDIEYTISDCQLVP